ncbi:beta-lactamase class A [Actinacidiphila yanglinensis]|uniref:Beta-lactamase class A n=1 Tax=Actinacidiphila yanglinensis TaxID=310779 RepID=A0A1H6DLY5_9ACTN|nr:serine hydrolase [Actinacidiphila yanglinensis]SEG86199.1 beta-lactamase class A [Actinacidiphila yanglinensis]
MTDDDGTLAELFDRLGCEIALCVQALDGAAEFTLAADRQVTPGSTMKVQVALEAETWFAEGRLDPREQVALPAEGRTPGPVGLSLFADEATLSLRDMVTLMLTISDNPSTDALLRRVGTGAVNATAARLGLTGTVVTSDLATLVDAVARDLGRADWNDLDTWAATASAEDHARADALLVASPTLSPTTGTRTTPYDMARLLRLIWTDQAGPPEACARVRAVMARQLTRHRLAAGFRRPVAVAAKSGSLLGVVRNEIGVITHPDGRRYAAAVFTRSRPGADDAAVNAAIGTAAARAVAALRAAGA